MNTTQLASMFVTSVVVFAILSYVFQDNLQRGVIVGVIFGIVFVTVFWLVNEFY